MNNKKLLIEAVVTNNYPEDYKKIFNSGDNITMNITETSTECLVQINYNNDFLVAYYKDIFYWFDVLNIWIEII